MKNNYLLILLSILVVSSYSCEKDESSLNNDQLYLHGVKVVEEGYFINVQYNDKYQPIELYFASSLGSDAINYNNIVSETEYSENGKIKIYKQPISDLEDPLLYNYSANKVDLRLSYLTPYQSCDLPFIGKGITTVYDFNGSNPYLVNSLISDTIFYEVENGNVTKISNIEHVLYEYTYDNNPYFGKGIIYDFFSSEFDFQWWVIPEFVPKNNITSVKKYTYADGGMFSPNKDEIQTLNFEYKYNQYGYPTEAKAEGYTFLEFYYKNK